MLESQDLFLKLKDYFALKNYAKLQIEQRINFIVEKQGNILCK